MSPGRSSAPPSGCSSCWPTRPGCGSSAPCWRASTPVNELAELVGAQPAAVSQHLAKLRLARLVRSRREGTRIFYVLDDAHVRRLVEEVLSHADHVTAHG